MEETENYTKVHSFLRTDLGLSEMMIRVFSYIFTLYIRGKPVYGQEFIARQCGLSTREAKKVLRCLMGIGILRKNGGRGRNAAAYEPAIPLCQTTTEAKLLLVHAVHPCSSAHDALLQCTRCTFNGAHGAPHIHNKYSKKDIPDENGGKRKTGAPVGISVGGEFHGQDTL